jgi:hypothetical protein
VPDRPSQPGGGSRKPYELPELYGDAPDPVQHDVVEHDDLAHDEPVVVVRGRDEDLESEHEETFWGSDPASRDAATAAATPVTAGEHDPEPELPTTAPDGRPLTRREIREQQQRARDSRKSQRPASTPRSRRKRWLVGGVIVVVLALLIPVAISYVRYVTGPGTDSLSVRSVEWIRDHGGNGMVNTIERWWYTNNPPPTGGSPDKIRVQGTVGTAPPKVTVTTLPQFQSLAPPAARVPTPAPDVQLNEGVWQPSGRLVAGKPAIYTTYVRPDAAHTSYYTGLMWLDTKLLKANYVVGAEQPGGGANPWGSQIPPDVQPSAIAAFNSGFKMDTANGGAYLDGQEIVGLRGGAASLVIYQDGTATVGAWGRDFNMSPSVKAVRQNLALMIDNGQIDPAVNDTDTTLWGATLGNKALVWRSGVGVTADGALIFAGGPALSVLSLARTLQAAGAVRAMEMDINTDWVSAFTYVPSDPNNPASPTMGVKLLDGMTHGGDQYLQPNSRDFFAFTSDPKPVVPTTTTTTRPTTTTKPPRK